MNGTVAAYIFRKTNRKRRSSINLSNDQQISEKATKVLAGGFESNLLFLGSITYCQVGLVSSCTKFAQRMFNFHILRF